MRAYGSNLAASIKRIKKTHKRTKFVSALYAFATFVLTVLAFFPVINVDFAGKGKLFIGSFFQPILNIFKDDLNVLDLITMLLYIVMAVLIVVNFIKCGSRFGKIMRRNSGNVTTCNKNLLIMEEIADAFSAAFSSFVIFNLVIYMINYSVFPAPKPFGSVTLWGVIAVAVATIVHFIGGVLGGNVSVFIIGSSIEEKKREDKIGLFFLRNLVQVIAVGAVLFFFAPATNLYIEIGNLFNKLPSALTNFQNIMAFLAVALQALVLIPLIILIKHATGTTEYSLIGMDGIGMKNFRVFGIPTAVLCLALFFLDNADGSHINYLIAGGIMAVATFADFLIKPRTPKVKEDDPALRKLKENAYTTQNKPEQNSSAQEQPQMLQFPAQAAGCCLYSRPCYPTGVTPQQQEEEAKQNEAADDSKDKAVPANVDGVPNGLPEGLPPEDEFVVVDVKCPSCSKLLRVKNSTLYHRCPSCDQVFTLRNGKQIGALIQEDPEEETVELD